MSDDLEPLLLTDNNEREAAQMNAPDNRRELARTDLSLCINQLQNLLATLRVQERFLDDQRSPYFDETIVIAHCHLDGAMGALSGIIARLDDKERCG
ncbi:MAG: hypothetical protein B7Y80_17555 [Hyphomicrobium sp. 32-62-53]|nr:MAG: hypothetical protein B7Z29_17250 [Hyphomicrobium sp. 12-62-95]OYX97956.1 MAG: hypothetical protein B7Y80_17555 [Hyphomicrobium sp. 32-62-53]